MSAGFVGGGGDSARVDSLSGALSLVEALGVRVLPVHSKLPNGACTCGKSACKSIAKHPIGVAWQRVASADDTLVRAEFARHPNANVGIATGVASGVVVIDIDGQDGLLTLEALQRAHGDLPPTPAVLTSRGSHLYFASGTAPIHNRAGAAGRGLGKGLDVRGEGGFVVAPPSVHESGHVYRWAFGCSPAELALALMPEWLVLLLTTAPPLRAAEPTPSEVPRSYVGTRAEKWAAGGLERECKSLRETPEGGRNQALNVAAFNVGMLCAGGALDAATAKRALRDAAIAAGLGEFEAVKTITSGFAAGLKKDARSGPTRDLPRDAGPYAGVAVEDNGFREPAGPDESSAVEVEKPSAMNPRYGTAQIFATLPTQRWVIPGLQLGPGRPTLIAGYGASAKTLAVQQLALAIASGRPAWNRFECAPGIVLHIDYEQGYFATAKRYQRLAMGHGIDPNELGDRLQYVEMPRVYLDRKEAEEEYLRACDGVDLVIIDALRGAAPNTDENDSAFRSSIDVCTYVSQRTGAAMCLLHHAGKPKDGHAADARTLARGSSAIYDASGCVLNFLARPGQAARLVTQVKMPAEAEGGVLEPFELLVEDVAIDGAANGGVRVVWREATIVDASEAAESAYQRDASQVIKAVRRNQGKSSNVIVSKCGIPRARALEVLRALAEEGRLVVSPGANRSKCYSVLGSAGGDNE